MSEPTTAEAVAPAPVVDKRAQVEELLSNVLKEMDYPAKLEFTDLSDGTLGVAVHFEGELPGITPGKRTYLVDCLQFLLNKCINRPGVERRWVTLGANGFPEPRQARPAGAAAVGPVVASAPRAAPVSAPVASSPSPSAPPAHGRQRGRGEPRERAPEREKHEKHERHEERHRRDEPDERALEVAADPLIKAAAVALAEKAAKLGRFYAVMLLSADDRARVVQGAAGVAGVRVKAEGEGHWRRVTFTPDKPVALPKKSHLMPDYDEEE